MPVRFGKWTLKVTSPIWSRIILRSCWPFPLSKFKANMDLQTPYLFLLFVAIFSNMFHGFHRHYRLLESTQCLRLLRFSTSHGTIIIVWTNTMANGLLCISTYGLDIGLIATSLAFEPLRLRLYAESSGDALNNRVTAQGGVWGYIITMGITDMRNGIMVDHDVMRYVLQFFSAVTSQGDLGSLLGICWYFVHFVGNPRRCICIFC